MRSLVFHGPDAVELIETEDPELGPGEAIVRIEISAICGSELAADPGTNPGHEAAGVVESVPPGSGFSRGDRVGISAVTGCGTCLACRRGVQLHCAEGPREHGSMHADYVVVPVSALRRLPDGISPLDAVLVAGDALGVPVRGYRLVPSRAGERVLVIGLGPVGLGHTLVRSYLGAEVAAVEPSECRRELARSLGASEVLAPGDDIGPPPTLVIECTGLPACIRTALTCVAAGGTVLQSGECSAVEVSPKATFIRREVTYTGTWYYADEDFPEMVRLYEDGLPVHLMVTHQFPADEVEAAYRTFISKNSGKVAIQWT